MKKLLPYLLLAVFWTACRSDNTSPFGVDPQLNAYSDEAPPTQKLFCSSLNCENPYSQDVYIYRSEGRLTRIDHLGRMASGQLERSFYTEYIYAPNGQLTGKIKYGSYGTDSRWVAYDESEYSYTDGVLTQERTYFNQHNPDQRVYTGRIEYKLKDGRKISQSWYDAQQTLYRRVVNAYKNNTLVHETWYGATNTVIRRFEHQFAGNRRQISEYLPNATEPISQVEKTYDEQGRLSSEETTVTNPLLCTMTAGVVRYLY